LAGAAHASLLTVLNPSFESPALEEGRWTITAPEDWTLSNSGGAVRFRASNYSSKYIDPVPDGHQVAYIANGSMTQTLTENLTANTEYALTVYVGNREDLHIDNYEIQLLAGGALIATSGTNPMMPGLGNWAPYTLTYEAGPNDAYLGQRLGIRMKAWSSSPDDLQTNFDMISLSATPIPIPGTACLLGLGLIGLIKRRSA